MYYKSGRWVVLITGFISFLIGIAGMCHLTQSSAHFYWYGVPTAFAIVYMSCHCECKAAIDCDTFIRSVPTRTRPRPWWS